MEKVFKSIFFQIIAWPVGILLYLASKILILTSRVKIIGKVFEGPAIYVSWHQHIPFLLIHHGTYKRWILISKDPSLETVVAWCKLLGLKIVRGGTGEDGMSSLAILEKKILKNKESAILAVDGPKGPGFIVKPGCILLARNTGYPLIPITYSSKRGFKISSRWDKRYMVTFFDEITLFYGDPIYVGKEDFVDNWTKVIEKKLNELGKGLS